MNFTASSFERMMKQKPLLAGPALCLLLSETFSQAGRREVTLWPAN